MTESEALESALKKIIAQEKSNWGYIENFDVDENWAVRTAIEQVQQYRQIGTLEECRAAMENQKKGLSVDEAKAIAAKAICIGCAYLTGYECSYKGGNCMTSKPMLESVSKYFDDWNRRVNDDMVSEN